MISQMKEDDPYIDNACHSSHIQQIYEGSLILFLPPDDLLTLLVGIMWDYCGAGIAWNFHIFTKSTNHFQLIFSLFRTTLIFFIFDQIFFGLTYIRTNRHIYHGGLTYIRTNKQLHRGGQIYIRTNKQLYRGD